MARLGAPYEVPLNTVAVREQSLHRELQHNTELRRYHGQARKHTPKGPIVDELWAEIMQSEDRIEYLRAL